LGRYDDRNVVKVIVSSPIFTLSCLLAELKIIGQIIIN